MVNTVLNVNAVAGAPSYNGRMLRQAMSALMGGATAARPLGARSGVRIGTPTTTVTATSTTWTINPHSGILDVQVSGIAGPYQYAIDTAVTGTVTAADATYARVDIAYVQVSDNAEDGLGAALLTPTYLAGTPSASPAAPTTPARSMVLATINVPKVGGGTPTAIWAAPFATAAGGIIPGTTAAAFGAGQYVGQYIDDPALGLLRWNGTAWNGVASAGAWTAYTPTLTGIALGNGTLVGFYQLTGKTLDLSVTLTFGTTTTFAGGGSTPIGVTIPSGMVTVGGAGRIQALPGSISDASAGIEYLTVGKIYGNSATTVFLSLNGSDVASVNGARPMLWANGDQFMFSGRIEVA